MEHRSSENNLVELLQSIKSGCADVNERGKVYLGEKKDAKMSIAHISNNESIALQLLQSPDSRVAAAAKRIFSLSPNPIEVNNSNALNNPSLTVPNDATSFSYTNTSYNQNNPKVQKNNLSGITDRTSTDREQMTLCQDNAILGMLATAAASKQHAQRNPTGCQEPLPSLKRSLQQSNLVPPAQHLQQHQTKNSQSFSLSNIAMNKGLSHIAYPITPRQFNIDNPSTIAPNMESIGDKSDIPEFQPSAASKDRMHRRERNRMHARKTRQRKKEQKQNLENEAQVLKSEQIQLKLQINEKNTANILLVMCNNNSNNSNSKTPNKAPFSSHKTNHSHYLNDEVEKLMQRDTKDIPDSSKIIELPALILPGHPKKRPCPTTNSNPTTSPNAAQFNVTKGVNSTDSNKAEVGDASKKFLQDYNEELMEGIDYNLLCKDRSTCTPAELDKIRKERNKMHAKRTRDRKRIFMEEMKTLISQLKYENRILKEYLDSLNNGGNSSLASKTIDFNLSSTPDQLNSHGIPPH